MELTFLDGPPNIGSADRSGTNWSAQEDRQLKREFNKFLYHTAKKHKRSRLAIKYRLKRNNSFLRTHFPNRTTEWHEIYTTLDSSITSYVDDSVLIGEEYLYCVTAIDDSEQESLVSNLVLATIPSNFRLYRAIRQYYCG